jgi:hypothetical protein
MAMTEVIETAVVERIPGKCPDCFGTGGVLDEDGSLTGVVGQPVACGCMSFLGCQVLAHPAGCGCRRLEIEEWRTRPVVAVSRRPGPSHWWGE